MALDCVTVMLRFGSLPAAIHWIDLPGIARYGMEFALYAPDRRLRLTFPSPFLRNEPTLLEQDGGEPGTPNAWRSVQTVSYEEAFKRELLEFHDAVCEGRAPRTDGDDGLRDVLLCQAIARAHVTGRGILAPTAVTAAA